MEPAPEVGNSFIALGGLHTEKCTCEPVFLGDRDVDTPNGLYRMPVYGHADDCEAARRIRYAPLN